MSKEDDIYELLTVLQGVMIPTNEDYNIDMLREKFHINELPALVLLDKFGNLVSKDGLHDIKKYTKTQLITKWSENFKKD